MTNQSDIYVYMANKQRFKGMSWAEVSFAIEDEEERQEKERMNRIIQELLAERRRLYALGQYELEEGEILE